MLQETIKSVEDIYSLSPFQTEMYKYFNNSFEKSIFNLLFSFSGEIDYDLFQKSWEKVIEKYAILRTNFVHGELKKPVQVVNKRFELFIEKFDWKNNTEEEIDLKIEECKQNEAAYWKDLSKVPLMKLSIIHSSDEEFKIWWRFPHILMDGWNIPVIMNDVINCYKSLYSNSNEWQNSKEYPYVEYVKWLKTKNNKTDEIFWAKYLKNINPESYQKNVGNNNNDKKILVRKDEVLHELFEPVNKWVKVNEVTLNSLFQSVFSLAMLKTFAKQKELTVTGTIVADRPLSLVNSHLRVGLYLNTIPIRANVEPDIEFSIWCKKMHVNLIEVLRFPSSDNESIKKWAKIDESLKLFEGVLIFENMPIEDNYFDNLPFKYKDHDFVSPFPCPLSLFVWPQENLFLKLIYDQNYFTAGDANELMHNYLEILKTVIEDKDVKVKKLID